MPQRFVLPSTGKAHSGCINGRIACKKGINLCLHIILRGNDVEEVFDDAETEIGFLLVDRNCYPWAGHASLSQNPQCKSAVPYTCMVSTIVSGDSDDCHPRVENGYSQRELLCYLLTNLVAPDVVVYPCQHTQWKYLSQHPRRWIRVRIGIAEMFNEIFAGLGQLRIYELPCLYKCTGIIETRRVGHPKGILRFAACDIDDSTADSNLYLLNLIEHQQSQMSIEAIHIQCLAESRARFEHMILLGCRQQWYVLVIVP